MNDFKFAFRQLLKSPGFTVVAVITLALGIGANSAIFSVVNAVLLRPLAYPESDRLLWLCERGPDWNGGAIAYPNFEDWRRYQSSFEHIGVYNGQSFVLTGASQPVQLQGARMSADVFAALRVQPVLGRFFTEEEDKPGAARVVLLSHSLWQSRFGASSNILNQGINLNGHAHTVVGIMPADFAFPDKPDVWVPVGSDSASPEWQNRGNHPGLYGIARLKDGVTLEQANADLDRIATRLEQEYPETNKTRRVHVTSLLENHVGDVRRALWILLGAVGMVLLIACANVANLLLARAAGRQKEIGIRAALGASRRRIILQLLTESVLLAFVGAAAGMLFANVSLKALVALGQNIIPRSDEIHLDGAVLLFSAMIALLTGILFGLAPAWQTSRVQLHDTLKDGSRATAGGRARLRQGLVIAEVALTLLLLVGSGLLLRSFHRLQKVNSGFVPERVLTFEVNLPEQKYTGPDRAIAFYQQLLEKLRAVPGVQAASVASRLPLESGAWDTTYLIEGEPEPAPHERPSMDVQLAGTDYFRAMGIPLLRGRAFTEQDSREHLGGTPREQEWAAALNVIIVNEQFAQRHWPNSDPIGKRVRMGWGKDAPLMTVVGVVPRVKWRRLNEDSGHVQAYLPFLQIPFGGMKVILKTAAEPGAIVPAARQQVLALDPEQPIHNVQTLTEMRHQNIAPQRLNLMLLAFFGSIALLLAVVGLYGVLAYLVAQRRREIGIRMALGAQRRDVLGLIVSQGMTLTLIGSAVGLAAAYALTRVLNNLLFEIRPTDPLTYAGVSTLLAAVAFLACWIPGHRAARLNPMDALRYE